MRGAFYAYAAKALKLVRSRWAQRTGHERRAAREGAVCALRAAYDSSNVTINANGNNDIDGVQAYEDSNVTINVTDENDFEYIEAHGNANITVQGTECQKKDTINLGEDEGTSISADYGNVVIDHVTINVNSSEFAAIGSNRGNVTIDTSKIAAGDDSAFTEIYAGGTMEIKESVIDITGVVVSVGQMTINHSDVKVAMSDEFVLPYAVWSYAGIQLINEKNGEVKTGELDGYTVYYVTTGDDPDVDLKADGTPAYYICKDDDDDDDEGMPKGGDSSNPFLPMGFAIASVATAGYAAKRRNEA